MIGSSFIGCQGQSWVRVYPLCPSANPGDLSLECFRDSWEPLQPPHPVRGGLATRVIVTNLSASGLRTSGAKFQWSNPEGLVLDEMERSIIHSVSNVSSRTSADGLIFPGLN